MYQRNTNTINTKNNDNILLSIFTVCSYYTAKRLDCQVNFELFSLNLGKNLSRIKHL